MSQIKSKPRRLIFRSATVWPSDLLGCAQRTNANFVFSNNLAREYLDRFNGRIEFFDGWPVEAPRYLDTCMKDGGRRVDLHYSCYGEKMSGAVGEAVAWSLLDMLAFG